jgi:hypothetical protein
MAAHGPRRRVLLHGIVIGALVLAASGSAGPVAFRSASAFAAAERLYGAPTATSEALFQLVREDQFCRLFSRDELCAQFADLARFCAKRPDNPLCAGSDEDRFCALRPDHPLCENDRFCRQRADHPLCNEDPPPSPS